MLKKYYWVWIILALFVVIQIVIQISTFDDNGPTQTVWVEVERTMLRNNEIEKITVVNQVEAHIYLKESSFEKYRNMLNKPVEWGPQFFFTIESVDSFEQRLQEVQSTVSEENKIRVEYKTVRNYFKEIMPFVMPLLFFIYFIPSIIGRKKMNSKAIFLLNLFLGWTFLGWVGAMVWAVMKDD